jgi:addiction module HigA family antidote
MLMKNPPHPGLSVRLDCLEPLKMSVTEGAKVLGVTRQALNNLVNGKAGISPEMALRLAKAFGSSPETWLAMQMAYDLAQAREHEGELIVQRVARPALEHPHP